MKAIFKNKKHLFFFLAIFLLAGAFLFFKKADWQQLGMKTQIISGRDSYKSIFQFPVQSLINGTWRTLGWKDSFSPEKLSPSGKEVYLRRSLPSCGYFAASNSLQCSHSNADMHEVKLFFAPGAGNASVKLSNDQTNNGERLIVVARFGQPPQGDYDNSSIFNRNDVSSEAADFSQINGKDFLTSNGDGITEIFFDHFDEDFAGGWLYLRIFESNKKIKDISYQQYLKDFEKYKTWYQTMTTANKWQSNGDPIDPYSYSFSAAEELAGDIEPLNSPDGDVDIFDYNVFIQYWSQSPTNNPSDIDKNGKVDIFDYNLLVGNFGKKN